MTSRFVQRIRTERSLSQSHRSREEHLQYDALALITTTC
jgi:hypothetical protein